MGFIFNLVALAKNAKQAVGSLQDAKEKTAYFRGALGNYQNSLVHKEYDRAMAGDNQAQYELGERFFQGLGVDQNYAHAAAWFHSAATLGHVKAQCNLAMMFFIGRGVDPDPAEAFKWICLASLHGGEEAISLKRKIESRISAEMVAEGTRRAESFQAPSGSSPESLHPQ